MPPGLFSAIRLLPQRTPFVCKPSKPLWPSRQGAFRATKLLPPLSRVKPGDLQANKFQQSRLAALDAGADAQRLLIIICATPVFSL
jgi:hypothetical protein